MKICITIPYTPYREALDWAKENCPSYITNDFHFCEAGNGSNGNDWYGSYDHTKIDYFFAEEKDATLFALRWS